MKTKKKKKGKGLVLAVLILIILLALYFVIDRVQKESEKESETEETEIKLPVSVTKEELSRVTVKNQETTMTFEKSDDAWIYKEDGDFPVDETALETKLNKLTSLSVDRMLESPEDLSEYGLDEPALEITVMKTDGTSFTLHIGDKNSSTNDYYMKVDDGADVYTVAGSSISAFEMEPYDVALSDGFPTIDSDSIRSIDVDKEDESIEFAPDESGVSWKMKAGEENEEAVSSTAMEDITGAVTGLTYNDFVDYKGDDLARYGLDDPKAVITVVTEETEAGTESEEAAEEAATESEAETDEVISESETAAGESESETEAPRTVISATVLLVGDTAEDGNSYYVKLQDNPEVHTMSASTLETLLNIDKLDFISSYLNDVPMTDMEKLEVTRQGETRILTIETEVAVVETEPETEKGTEESGSDIDAGALDQNVTDASAADISAGVLDQRETEETETETESESETETEPETETIYHYLVDGEEVDESAFRIFYNNAVYLQAQKRTEEVPEVTGEPELKLVFTRKDGTTLTTEYYLADDGLYDVLSDQNLPARISKLDVQKVLDYYDELINPEPETETESDTQA